MDKKFENYLHETRGEFVKAVNELQWNTGFRTKCENLLIAFDQMKQALRQQPVSGSLPPDELEKSLGSTNRQFTIWHDGGEWLISLKGKEHEQCKTLREWIGGNGR